MVVLDLSVVGQRLLFWLIIDSLCDTNADTVGRPAEEIIQGGEIRLRDWRCHICRCIP